GASGANQAQGAVYVYDSSGDLLQTLSEPNGSPEDYFGISVAAAGANVVIGAPGANGGQGAAYFYLGTLTKSTTSTTLTDNGPNLSTYGDSLNFTVNVSPSQGSVPDGETVLLEDASQGNAVIGSGMLTDGSAMISVPS